MLNRVVPLFLFYLFLSSRSYSPKLPPKTILVFDFHLIGDIVLLTPLLQVLRGAYPDARIVLVAGPWAQELLCGEEFLYSSILVHK